MRPSAPPRTSHGVITCSRAAPTHSFIALPCQLSWRRVRSLNRDTACLRQQGTCSPDCGAFAGCGGGGSAPIGLAANAGPSLCVLPACWPYRQAGRVGWLATQRPRPRLLTHLAAQAPLCTSASASTGNAQAACHCSLPARLVLGIRFCRGPLATTCKVLSQLTGEAQH